MRLLYLKGATAHEFQIGRFYFRISRRRFVLTSGVLSHVGWEAPDGETAWQVYIGPLLFKESRKKWRLARNYGASKRKAWKMVLQHLFQHVIKGAFMSEKSKIIVSGKVIASGWKADALVWAFLFLVFGLGYAAAH